MASRRFPPPPPTKFAPPATQPKAAGTGSTRGAVAPPAIPRRPGPPTVQAQGGVRAWPAAPPTRFGRSPAHGAPRGAIQRAQAPVADDVVVHAPANTTEAAALAARGVALRMAATDVKRLASTQGIDAVYDAAQERLRRGSVYAEDLRTHLWCCVAFYQFAGDARRALDGVLAGSAGRERESRFMAFVRALEDATGAIQIVHPEDYAGFAADTSQFEARLKGLQETTVLAAGIGAGPDDIVEHLFDHDKSFLVAIGAIDGLMAGLDRPAEDPDPVGTFLKEETNTHTISGDMVAKAKRSEHLKQHAAHLPALAADWTNSEYYLLRCAAPQARPFKNFKMMMRELVAPVMLQLRIADERTLVTTRLAAFKDAYPMLPSGYFDKLLARIDDVFPA